MKRLFDLLVSSLGLVLFSPIWLLAAVAIKLEDGGPVFFSQARVGRGGRSFMAYKFRSMTVDAGDPARQAKENDTRITRVGRVLRATAMDELPQLWNIFRGDMSVVGPRPLMPGEIETQGDGRLVALEAVPGFSQRHSVRPGLTGLTQVFAPRDVPRARKFRLDLLYIKRASLCLDLRLVVLSFWITLRGRWERREPKI
jgi:lipopolysaccharide/colanic/teichoic acid biosynthesis glycosyltransferase